MVPYATTKPSSSLSFADGVLCTSDEKVLRRLRKNYPHIQIVIVSTAIAFVVPYLMFVNLEIGFRIALIIMFEVAEIICFKVRIAGIDPAKSC